MRFLILAAALTLTACGREEAAVPTLGVGTFAGDGRNVLCVAGAAGQQRAGFIVYGEGDANCSARGRIEPKALTWDLVPDGEGECRIPVSVKDDRISLRTGHPSCTYYCGKGATWVGETFQRTQTDRPAADLAGDQVC